MAKRINRGKNKRYILKMADKNMLYGLIVGALATISLILILSFFSSKEYEGDAPIYVPEHPDIELVEHICELEKDQIYKKCEERYRQNDAAFKYIMEENRFLKQRCFNLTDDTIEYILWALEHT